MAVLPGDPDVQARDMTDQPRNQTKKARLLKSQGSKAFDAWLQQGLHKIYDDIAREPVPDELLRLIEEHREK